jgi:RNA polymerase sigma-70 factor (ECF subfamily)
VANDFAAELTAHRPALLRHCYRMMGCFAEAEDLVQDALERAWQARASYRGEASLRRWLFTIATNACLNALARRKRQRSLPPLDGEPWAEVSFEQGDPSQFVTPAPDGRLFPDPAEAAESRETVALAFVALLQQVPPRQRAALLVKDVLGWSAEETARALGLTLPAVNSALHRGREAVAGLQVRADEPGPATAQHFVRAWETRDLDGLVALLRDDIALVMPPYAMWLRGVEAVSAFFRSPRFTAFWSAGVHLAPTRANGSPAFGFYRGDGTLHSIMVTRFVDQRVAEMTVFIGPDYFSSFDLLPRTVSGASPVLDDERRSS